jgi:hypothetical protein
MNKDNTFQSEKQEFSYFQGPITNCIPVKNPMNLGQVYNLITSDELKEATRKIRSEPDDKKRRKLKEQLPYMTVGGVFTRRDAKNITRRSGLIVVDIDHVSSMETLQTVDQLKARILDYAIPALWFTSPSGDGLKVIYAVDIIDGEHDQFMASLESFYLYVIGVKIDGAGKDVARACFLCHDKEARLFENPDVLDSNFLRKYTNEQDQSTKQTSNPVVRIDQTVEYPIVAEQTVSEIKFKPHSPLDTAAFMIQGAKDGEKHHKLFSAARLLGGYVGSGEFSRDTAVELLESEIQKKVIVSFPEAQKTIQDGLNEGIKAPLYTLGAQPAVEVDNQSDQEAEPEQHHESEPGPKSPKAYYTPINVLIELQDSMPPVKSVWGGVKAVSFGYIFGPPKSGKTIACENLGFNIASGVGSFLGTAIDVEPQKVLFLSLEEHWRLRTKRNKMQVDALKRRIQIPFEGNYLTSNDEFPRYLLSGNEWKILEDTIIQSGCKIVFIDSLTRMIKGQIEDSQTASDVSKKLRDMAYRLGVCMIIIHHTRKQNGLPISIDSLAGSRVLAQEADFMIGINKAPDGTRYMKEVAFRYQQENNDFVQSFRIDKDCWIERVAEVNEHAILTSTDTDGRHDDTNVNLVFEEIERQAGEQNSVVATSTLYANLVDKGLLTNPTLHAALEKLLKRNKIVKPQKGQYQVKK